MLFIFGGFFVHYVSTMSMTHIFFFIYRAKRNKFRWRGNHDIYLLTELISIEPYKWKQGSKERGEAFPKIAKNLVQIPNSGFPDSLSQRAVRTRFFELLDMFKNKN